MSSWEGGQLALHVLQWNTKAPDQFLRFEVENVVVVHDVFLFWLFSSSRRENSRAHQARGHGKNAQDRLSLFFGQSNDLLRGSLFP